MQAAEAQKTLIGNLAQLPTRPAPANGRGAAQPDWTQIFGIIGQRFAEAQKTVLETQVKMREVDRQIKDLEGKLASLAPAQDERTEVKIFVNAGGRARGRHRHPLPGRRRLVGALLRRAPRHRHQGAGAEAAARAPRQHPAAQRRELGRRRPRPLHHPAGCGNRRAGAAAGDRRLRAGCAAAPDPTGARVRRAALARESAEVDRVACGLRKDALRAKSAPAPEPRPGRGSARQRSRRRRFQAIYAIAGRVTVPPTGEAKRVQIDEAQLEPALTVRTVPKRDQKAFLYAKVAMARGTPILPGQVSLFRDGTFVGNGRLPLLAPGEEHELGFGIDDSVRVRHTIAEEKRAETGIITSSKTDTRSYRITVKNLHARAIPVTVIDQIPVSQNGDIKIELLGKTAPTKRDLDDKRGVLAWEMSLQPDEEKAVEFGYRVTWPAAKRITLRQLSARGGALCLQLR